NRNLKFDTVGQLAHITRDDLKDRTAYPDWNPIYIEPTRYNVWLTESEWRALVPMSAKKDDRISVPDAVRLRLFRYHLVNGTFGLPGAWRRADIRKADLSLIIEETSPLVRVRLEGAALLATDADVSRATRGLDCRLAGMIEFDPKKEAFRR